MRLVFVVDVSSYIIWRCLLAKMVLEMPRFSPKGPVVPDSLVQDLEDDRVVIFCGAGISMGAGLPDFNGLVKHCYDELSVTPPADKSEEWLWPDRMLGFLEAQCSPEDVRRAIVSRLSEKPTDLELHSAILKLARLNRVVGLRLVTTNFDTIFECARTNLVFGKDLHSGPVLPIPRNDRGTSWRSIAYLHGRIAPPPASNDHLVLTSADFGRAYLTEGWAARFVTRLFNDFIVLFIGYSLNDPVLRYMTDAFAAEEETKLTPEREPAYIFVSYRGSTAPDEEMWRRRRLKPIFYNQAYKHRELKRTLIGWAAAREDFLSSTGAIVDRYARSRPQSLDPSDAENLIWAVVGRPNDAGHGAGVFAKVNPPAPIQWLFEIENQEIKKLENWRLAKENATQREERPPPRPATYLRELFSSASDSEASNLPPTSLALCRWLALHLESIELVDWVVEKLEKHQRLHPHLRFVINARLTEASAQELRRGFATFWRIVSAEGPWARPDTSEAGWMNLISASQQNYDEIWFEQELLAQWRPYIWLSKAIFRQWREKAYGVAPEIVGDRIGTVAEVEIRLVGRQHLRLIGEILDKFPDPNAFLARHISQFTMLLNHALDLFAMVGRAGDDWDQSVHDRPFIVPNAQNRDYREWATLFDLLWRGWERIDQTDQVRSREIVHYWRGIKYLAFRRLVLAAVTKSDSFTPAEKLEVLLNG